MGHKGLPTFLKESVELVRTYFLEFLEKDCQIIFSPSQTHLGSDSLKTTYFWLKISSAFNWSKQLD